MNDKFEALQDRIEGILVLMDRSKRFEERVRLLRELLALLEELERLMIQETEPLLKRTKAAGAD